MGETALQLTVPVNLPSFRFHPLNAGTNAGYAHLYPNKQQELVSKLEAIGSPSSNDDESDLMSLG